MTQPVVDMIENWILFLNISVTSCFCFHFLIVQNTTTVHRNQTIISTTPTEQALFVQLLFIKAGEDDNYHLHVTCQTNFILPTTKQLHQFEMQQELCTKTHVEFDNISRRNIIRKVLGFCQIVEKTENIQPRHNSKQHRNSLWLGDKWSEEKRNWFKVQGSRTETKPWVNQGPGRRPHLPADHNINVSISVSIDITPQLKLTF